MPTVNKPQQDMEKAKFGKRNGEIYVRVNDVDTENSFDTINTVSTTVSTSATKLNTPENARDFIIFHEEDESVYIGSSNVTTAALKLEADDILEVSNMTKDNENELYGLVSTGTVTIYVTGAITE